MSKTVRAGGVVAAVLAVALSATSCADPGERSAESDSATTSTTSNSSGATSGSMPSNCMWHGPYVKGRDGYDYGFTDPGGTYWTLNMKLPKGADLVLRGDYPHARYQSFSAYDAKGRELDSRNDSQLKPMNGSANPFLPGASRSGEDNRSFKLKVADAPIPAQDRKSNTLYAGSAADRQVLIMRTFVPDEGTDMLGGVGFPKPELRLPDGEVVRGSAVCDELGVIDKKLTVTGVPTQKYDALRERKGAPKGFPAEPKPIFRAYFNKDLWVKCTYSLTPAVDCNPSEIPENKGGIYSNLDNGYLRLYASRDFGDLLVVRGKVPTTPKTLTGGDTMESTDLRYWSICSNESLLTTKVEGCLHDEQIPLDKDRDYEVVISLAKDRPTNAVKRCGVGYLPWPPAGDGGKHPEDAYIGIRNMLPSKDFGHAVQDVRAPGQEAKVMGAYYPSAEYMSTEDFEKRGCSSTD